MGTIKQDSTNNFNRNVLKKCDLTYALDLVGGRWKLIILMILKNGKLRYSQIRKELPLITERMLTLQLKNMEQDRLIIRTVYAEVPVKVEYNLSNIGLDLIPICYHLLKWGEKHKTQRYPLLEVEVS